MTTIEKIRAEIERRKNNAETLRERNICIDILTFIDTLESEKPFKEPIDGVLYAATCGIKNKGQIEKLEKPVPDDLDKAAEEATIKEGILAGPNFEVAVRTFKAGVKWRDSHFPKLPDDLDKAARKSAVAPFNFELDEEHLYEYPYLPIAEQKFKEGAKWGAEHTPLPEDTVLFNKGVEEGKRLMMEDAVEGEVTTDNRGNNIVRAGVFNRDFEYGDKVRAIVCKKEN